MKSESKNVLVVYDGFRDSPQWMEEVKMLVLAPGVCEFRLLLWHEVHSADFLDESDIIILGGWNDDLRSAAGTLRQIAERRGKAIQIIVVAEGDLTTLVGPFEGIHFFLPLEGATSWLRQLLVWCTTGGHYDPGSPHQKGRTSGG